MFSNSAQGMTLVFFAAMVVTDSSPPEDTTTLHQAVHRGKLGAVRKLLGAGADPNAATDYGVLPLSIACQAGDTAMVRLLLDAGADPQATLPGGETPLMTAARTGDPATVRALLDAGVEVDAREARKQTALMWAAAAGNDEALAVLLGAGADPGATSRGGFNALHFAAREGQIEAAEALLDAGAEVDAPIRLPGDKKRNPKSRAPRDGMSAQLLAVESGHFELALELVERGADPNDLRSGYTPLHAVSWVRKANRGDDPSGDPEPRGSGGVTSVGYVKRLVASGADVNLAVEEPELGNKQLKHRGATPVLFAARTADLPLLRLLVELGGDPLRPTEAGVTPLMAAAGVGVQSVGEEAGTEPEVLEVVRYLIGLGADVNAIAENRETAMHGAAYRNFPLVVDLLAESGADPAHWDHKNDSGWTPMRIAEGYRPGSFKPNPPTQAALRRATGR